MSQIVVLHRARVLRPRQSSLARLHRQIEGEMSKGPGLRSTTVWRDERDHDMHLLAFDFQDENSSRDAQYRLIDSPIFEEAMKMMEGAADIVQVRVLATGGASLGEVPLFGYLSLSYRIAEPGLYEEIGEELERIFSELATYEGYVGHLRGVSLSLEEEAVGLVAWSDEASFERSLPAKSLYKVDLYRRIH